MHLSTIASTDKGDIFTAENTTARTPQNVANRLSTTTVNDTPTEGQQIDYSAGVVILARLKDLQPDTLLMYTLSVSLLTCKYLNTFPKYVLIARDKNEPKPDMVQLNTKTGTSSVHILDVTDLETDLHKTVPFASMADSGGMVWVTEQCVTSGRGAFLTFLRFGN